MAGRLIYWPNGLRANFREPLSGPRTVGAAATQSVGSFVQTSGAAFGLWRWRFQFPPLRRQLARRYRGWITGLHGGANATTVPFCDWDGLSREQMGVAEQQGKQNWSNGMPWSNGNGWQFTPPVVAVASGAALGDTTVSLADKFWGHGLGIGDQLGFHPFHFGLYMVTEVQGDGQYRIWPPLRKALTTDDSATLRPVLTMRLESEESATAPRDAVSISGASVTLIEVLDYDARDYFAG